MVRMPDTFAGTSLPGSRGPAASTLLNSTGSPRTGSGMKTTPSIADTATENPLVMSAVSFQGLDSLPPAAIRRGVTRVSDNRRARPLVPAGRPRGLGAEPGLHDQRVLAGVEVVALAPADHAEAEALVEGQRLDVGRPHLEEDQLHAAPPRVQHDAPEEGARDTAA